MISSSADKQPSKFALLDRKVRRIAQIHQAGKGSSRQAYALMELADAFIDYLEWPDGQWSPGIEDKLTFHNGELEEAGLYLKMKLIVSNVELPFSLGLLLTIERNADVYLGERKICKVDLDRPETFDAFHRAVWARIEQEFVDKAKAKAKKQ